MAAPTLGEYEYQFKDAGTGVLLNGDDSSLPFYDVTKVEGLVGLPEGSPVTYDRDGAHGSTVHYAYMPHRVIAIEGYLYTAASSHDSTWKTLALTMVPDGLDYPLYFNLPGLSQLYYWAKPVRARLAMTADRRIGRSPFQLQWMVADPRAYDSVTTTSLTSGVTSTITNAGDFESLPKWTCSANASTSVTIRVENEDQSRWVQFAFTTPSGSSASIEVDTSAHTLKVNGSIMPATFTKSGGWPSLDPGTNDCKITLTNATSGALEWQSAWML